MFTRPPPPRGAPPPYTFVTRVYRRSLRPVVVAVALLSAVWALVWGVASFKDIAVDKGNAPKLQVFDIVLGALYMAALAVELLGLIAAALQKLFMIRLYAFLSLGTAVIVIGTELLRVVIHFVFKQTLIDECTNLVKGDTVTTRFGIWGPTTTTILDDENAHSFCSSAWSHDSFSEIAWFVVTAVCSLLFASVAFSYYRQVLDPTSPANASRAPSAQARAAAAMYPEHYSPPYAGDGGFGGFGAYGRGGAGGAAGPYAPPPGPPPGASSTAYVPAYDPVKLPEYDSKDGYAAGGARGDDKDGDPFADFTREGRADREGDGDGARRT